MSIKSESPWGCRRNPREAISARFPPISIRPFLPCSQAQADLIQSAAQLGVVHSFGETPKQMLAAFEKDGDINRTFARLAAEAPDIKQAEAKLEAAKRDLAASRAELALLRCRRRYRRRHHAPQRQSRR